MPRDKENLRDWLKNRPAVVIEKTNKQRRERYAKVSKSPKARKARAKSRNDYYKSHDKPYHCVRTKRYKDKLKLEVVTAYGGKCTCCGEPEIDFLTVEHLNNDGKSHRSSGVRVYADIRSRGFPDVYTIHCFNCNIAKSLFGVCPHQRKV